jgi:hypothetical protein
LRDLRNVYQGKAEKLAILDAVIEDASLEVKKEGTGLIRLREKYANYLLFGFAQTMFLPESNSGVCYSITVHWARRILLGKAHFGVMKVKTVYPIELDATQKARMMKKIDTVRPLQAELSEYSWYHFSTI